MPPLLRKKGAPANFLSFDENTDQVFLRYGIGNTREIPTEYQPKIPNWYTTLFFAVHWRSTFLRKTSYILFALSWGTWKLSVGDRKMVRSNQSHPPMPSLLAASRPLPPPNIVPVSVISPPRRCRSPLSAGASWGGDGKKEGVKVSTNHIQQSTKAGGGTGRQWGVGADGGQ